MSGRDQGADAGTSLASNRSMDMVVALLMIALASVFMFDSWRIGFGWIEGQGPAPGFFPFYVSLTMALVSAVSLVRAAMGLERQGDQSFVGRKSLQRVMLVLVPTLLYVFAIQYMGIYVSSAVFLAGFMLAFREGFAKAVLIGIGAPLLLFFLFEKWFLVPLPKGPLEAMLGL